MLTEKQDFYLYLNFHGCKVVTQKKTIKVNYGTL